MKEANNEQTSPFAALMNIFFALSLAGSLLSFSGCTQQDTGTENAAEVNITQKVLDKRTTPPAVFANIQVSFKMDPRITRGLYMGDRWVSPSIYTGTVGQTMVEARAYGFDMRGIPLKINPKWISSDPEMVTVSPGEGHEVKISVKRAGKSILKVISEGGAKALSIEATEQGGALQVEIMQVEVSRMRGGNYTAFLKRKISTVFRVALLSATSPAALLC